jgi:hypothetical protein
MHLICVSMVSPVAAAQQIQSQIQIQILRIGALSSMTWTMG